MPDVIAEAPLLLCACALLVGGASALLPLLPIEPLLIGASVTVSRPLLVPIVALATLGHMGAKTLLYLASRGAAERMIPLRQRASLDRVRALLSRRRPVQLLTLLASAVAGLPPFYVVTVCYGMLRLPLRDYLVVGVVGRALRFTALVLLPEILV